MTLLFPTRRSSALRHALRSAFPAPCPLSRAGGLWYNGAKMGRPQHRRRADLQEEERERMLTSLPNILTMSRIAAIPLLLALIYVDTPLYRWVALAGYVVACVTDYFEIGRAHV